MSQVYKHEHVGRGGTDGATLAASTSVERGTVALRLDSPGERAHSHTLTVDEFDALVLAVYLGLGREAPLFGDAPANAGEVPDS